MLALVAARGETIVCIAFFEEAHRDSCLCVAFLNDARLGQSLKCGRREGKIAYYFDHTPIPARVPVALLLFVISGFCSVLQKHLLSP